MSSQGYEVHADVNDGAVFLEWLQLICAVTQTACFIM